MQKKLYIAYGHTSHGSQFITDMNALKSYFTDVRYNWSIHKNNNQLHLHDGAMLNDLGDSNWSDYTRDYLNENLDCNMIIWS